jgi:hypothetical protein
MPQGPRIPRESGDQRLGFRCGEWACRRGAFLGAWRILTSRGSRVHIRHFRRTSSSRLDAFASPAPRRSRLVGSMVVGVVAVMALVAMGPARTAGAAGPAGAAGSVGAAGGASLRSADALLGARSSRFAAGKQTTRGSTVAPLDRVVTETFNTSALGLAVQILAPTGATYNPQTNYSLTVAWAGGSVQFYAFGPIVAGRTYTSGVTVSGAQACGGSGSTAAVKVDQFAADQSGSVQFVALQFACISSDVKRFV